MFVVKFTAYKSVFSWLYYDDLLVVKYVLSVSKQVCRELLLLLRTLCNCILLKPKITKNLHAY